MESAQEAWHDEQCHLMVQVMDVEWFLADRDALESYYGQGFLEAVRFLKLNPNVEQVSKQDVIS